MHSQRPAGSPSRLGRSLQLGGVGVVFKLDAADTGGAFSVFEHPIAPGILVFPHVHTREDEYSYVVEGTVGARVGDEVFEASAGSCLVKPRGIPHTLWNSTSSTARVLAIVSPGGFERYFEELAAIFAAGVPPDMHAVAALVEGYGLKPQLDWVPQLEQAHGVTLNRPATDAEPDD